MTGIHGYCWLTVKEYFMPNQFYDIGPVAKHRIVLLSRNWWPAKITFKFALLWLVPHLNFCLATKFVKQEFLLNSLMKLCPGHRHWPWPGTRVGLTLTCNLSPRRISTQIYSKWVSILELLSSSVRADNHLPTFKNRSIDTVQWIAKDRLSFIHYGFYYRNTNLAKYYTTWHDVKSILNLRKIFLCSRKAVFKGTFGIILLK